MGNSDPMLDHTFGKYLVNMYRALPGSARRRIRMLLESASYHVSFDKTKRNKRLARIKAGKAKAFYLNWKLSEALEHTTKALELSRTDGSIVYLHCQILALNGKIKEARRIILEWIQLHPLDVKGIRILKYLGESHEFQRDFALDYLQNSNNPKILADAAEYLIEGGFPQETIEVTNKKLASCDEILNRDDVRSSLLFFRGMAYLREYLFGKAIDDFAAVEQNSAYAGRSIAMTARCLLELQQGREAEETLRTYYAKVGKSIGFQGTIFASLLQQNMIQDAHLSYRERDVSKSIAQHFGIRPPPSALRLLSRSHVNADVLLIAEGGPGDELRFSCMYPEIQKLFRSVSISCDPRLHSLLSKSFPGITFIPTKRFRKEVLSSPPLDRTQLTDARLYPILSDELIQRGKRSHIVISVLDVLGELRTNREDFHRGPGRIRVSEQLQSEWASAVPRDNRYQVGLAWRSLLMAPDRNRHYLKVEDLEPLKELDNVDFWILQAGATDSEIRFLQRHLSVKVPNLDLRDDFDNQAALIANLDLVVSPLTTMAELSGMVGQKTLILCRSPEAIWRRNPDGSDVWYKEAQLLTAPNVHDAAALVDELLKQIGVVTSQKE